MNNNKNHNKIRQCKMKIYKNKIKLTSFQEEINNFRKYLKNYRQYQTLINKFNKDLCKLQTPNYLQ
jgi:hypothetical protein